MESIKVKIKGVSPLLMNKYNMDGDKSKKKVDIYNKEDDVIDAVYYDEKIGYYAPSTWIESSIREAAKSFKAKGKRTLKETVVATTFCEEEKIPLNKKYDEIDSRFARIQRNGIIKHRPRWNTWELEFTLTFDPDRMSKETLLEIVSEAGKVKGIGDYRPKFGRFKVVE